MSALADHLTRRFDVPVVDGIASALGLASMLVRMRLSTSRQGFYGPQARSSAMQHDRQ
jgi:allantoin racemase